MLVCLFCLFSWLFWTSVSISVHKSMILQLSLCSAYCFSSFKCCSHPLSSHPFYAVKLSCPNSKETSRAFSCNSFPLTGIFLLLATQNHSHIRSFKSLYWVRRPWMYFLCACAPFCHSALINSLSHITRYICVSPTLKLVAILRVDSPFSLLSITILSCNVNTFLIFSGGSDIFILL